MRIVADENIPGLCSTFGTHGRMLLRKGREISAADLEHTDVLLIRSITKVDRELLANSPVQFIGSATIGIDHIDTDFLQNAGIHWSHAPGCNADAAAQYTLAMILLAAQRTGQELAKTKAGIVGFGNVGKRLHRMLKLLGIQEVLVCDPPLAAAGHAGLVDLNQIAGCNLISFHVPLTDKGPCPTWHLGNQKFFDQLHCGTLLINSSRGNVLDGAALANWLSNGRGHAALDVWPDEPRIEKSLLEAVIVATPHVAGYSVDGKLNGTRMLYQQFLQWAGIEADARLPPFAPLPQPLSATDAVSVPGAVLASCPVETDDSCLRGTLGKNHAVSAEDFDALRKNYPPRRDFAGMLIPDGLPEVLSKTLIGLGYSSRAH
jgi:erythronate-4-phosphate dehydrogenase